MILKTVCFSVNHTNAIRILLDTIAVYRSETNAFREVIAPA